MILSLNYRKNLHVETINVEKIVEHSEKIRIAKSRNKIKHYPVQQKVYEKND